MLIIHVGLHKTGSTAIQQTLQNLHSRRKGRVNYLGSGGLVGVDREEVKNHSKRIIAETQRNSKVHVISSENLLGRPEVMYRGAVGRAESLNESLTSKIECRVILYLRDLPSWVESVCVQMVHEGSTKPSDDVALQMADEMFFDYSIFAQSLIDVFGCENTTIRCYKKSAVIEDFLRVIGLESEAVGIRTSTPNQSIDTFQAMVLQSISQLGDPQLSKSGRQLLQSVRSNKPREPRSLLSESIQEMIVRRARADLPHLRNVLDAGSGQPADLVGAWSWPELDVKPQVSWDRDSHEIYGSSVQGLAEALRVLQRSPGFGNSWQRALSKLATEPGAFVPSLYRGIRGVYQSKGRWW